MARPQIVCEIGQNHCGNMGLAKILMGFAKLYGADFVKFQLYDHRKIYGDNGHIPNVELSFEQAKGLFEYGKAIGIEVFFSVFDIDRVNWCKEIGVDIYKIAFSQRNNKELIQSIPEGKDIIVSSDIPTGYITLFCTGEYPSTYVEVPYSSFSGLSDHSIGLDVAKKAIESGAGIIEKHFALNHETGVDAKWSMTPKELKELVRYAR